MRVMFRTLMLFGFFLFATATALFSQDEIAGAKIKVVTTLFPFYEFAREVAGDRAEVTLLLPAGIFPGHRMMHGTRVPPSHDVPFPSRNGSAEPA